MAGGNEAGVRGRASPRGDKGPEEPVARQRAAVLRAPGQKTRVGPFRIMK